MGLAWKQVEEGRKQNEEEGLQIKEAWLIEQSICCLCIIWNMLTDQDPTIWWLNRADWEVVIYIGWAWQGQISSNLVSTGCQSEHILLCQQVWRMMLLRRIMPWATWLRLSTAIMHYWLPCKIWSAMDNPHLRYRLWIFAHSALSTGVDNDANEEQDAVVLVTKHGWLGGWNA